ncbi:NAD(P)/FAD-dependent oxidoreductase [Streptosporangiaceae bacterium NEAU-GS5]|nr:NAD(P)/FAD-dependent oxidoreductase [Streptosporangiaceae bacterium NEAU-GS5]
MTEYDAVVVGAGPNGLVAAVTLATEGHKVLLLEGSDAFGGGLRSDELTLPGFRHDVGATVMAMALASPAMRELGVEKDGVEWAHPPVPAAHPLDAGHGPAVLVHRDLARTAEGLGRDGAAWRATVGATARAGFPLVDTLLAPLSVPRAPVRAARFGVLGVLPATVLARTAFRTERARAAFAGMAAHSMLDLGAPITSGYGLMLASSAHLVGWPVVRGGAQELADALVSRLVRLGGEAVTGHPVKSLAELPPTRTTILNLTPRQIVQVAGDRLPGAYRRKLERFRYGPGVFKVDWALDGPVPWRDPEVGTAGTVHLGGALDEIAYAEAEVARGRHAERPYVLVVQPTVADPTRAPAGKHILWAYCHVPNGSTSDMTEIIEDQIERFAPGFRDLILARSVLNPADLERRNANLVGGDIGGGSAALSQFIRRPVYSPRPWATPVPGLFISSASTPPGAAVHGMGGRQAARLAIKALAGGRR